MRYFFILGSNPVLSAAEIMSLLPGRQVTVTEMYKQALVVETPDSLDTTAIMNRLGGTIKIGRLLTEEESVSDVRLVEFMRDHLLINTGAGKTADFGFSIYALERETPMAKAAVMSSGFRNAGMEVKRLLKEKGMSVRWVKAQTGPMLSSVVVAKNRLVENGAEFVVLLKGDQMRIGVTEVVQPFEDFSEADYGRPSRDTVQGMLPPKLARIMINLINVSVPVMEVSLLDPFCGSGTILTEALRIGFDRVYGSDKNPEAVESTKKNIAWMKEQNLVSSGNHVEVFVSDARQLAQKLPPHCIDSIVTEPYLGPPRSGQEKRGEMQKQLADLSKLYYESLSSWKQILRPNAPVVMALPVYIVGMEKHGIQTGEFEKLGFMTEPLLPPRLLSRIGVPETKNHGLLYGRNDQYVWREIVRMRYNGS
jgi:tRNA G10  N-methylase Trm11